MDPWWKTFFLLLADGALVVEEPICAAVSQVLSDVLYGLGAHDPVAFVGVPLFLLGVAFLASYLPARRAHRPHNGAAVSVTRRLDHCRAVCAPGPP